MGLDGMKLLEDVYAPNSPPELRELGEVQVLRRTWLHQYVVLEGQLSLRESKDQPPVSQQTCSPYETEARYGAKGEREWIGYKSHLTETCDQDESLPRLVVQVETTIAPASDVAQLAPIHAGLAQAQLLPLQHLVDAGYVGLSGLIDTQREHQIDLVGPIASDQTWQAKAGEGFDASHFTIDWRREVVTCPQGHESALWCKTQDDKGRPLIHVDFARDDCLACPVRAKCTRARVGKRSLTLYPEAEHQALQAARERQRTEEFAALYANRAGIEGTISQGVRVQDLRQARYRGLAKTHLQHVATATAIDFGRLSDWLNHVPRARTRLSPFAALAHAN